MTYFCKFSQNLLSALWMFISFFCVKIRMFFIQQVYSDLYSEKCTFRMSYITSMPHAFIPRMFVQKVFPFITAVTLCAGSGWVDLLSFTAAHMVLCFSFVAKIVLITDQLFDCYWAVLAQHQRLFFLSLCIPSEYTGGGQEVGKGHGWDPNRPKGNFIPCDVPFNNKSSRRGGEAGSYVVMVSSQVIVVSLAFQGVAGQLPVSGKKWKVPSFLA